MNRWVVRRVLGVLPWKGTVSNVSKSPRPKSSKVVKVTRDTREGTVDMSPRRKYDLLRKRVYNT